MQASWLVILTSIQTHLHIGMIQLTIAGPLLLQIRLDYNPDIVPNGRLPYGVVVVRLYNNAPETAVHKSSWLANPINLSLEFKFFK